MPRPDLAHEIDTVGALCRTLGLGAVTPTPVRLAHHTTLRLWPLGMVARVQSLAALDTAWPRAVRELAVARHLARHGGPALAPLLPETLAGPHVAGSLVVTLWPYVEHARAAGAGDAALAATTLAEVHRALANYAGELPPYTVALDRCWSVLADGRALALDGHDKYLLRSHYQRLRHAAEALARPSGWHPLHGDAHLGNLLLVGRARARRGLWVDFEEACRGPREHDIACLPPAAWSRFCDTDPAGIRVHADLKSVCVAVWCAADASRSPAMREAAAYHLGQIRQWPAPTY